MAIVYRLSPLVYAYKREVSNGLPRLHSLFTVSNTILVDDHVQCSKESKINVRSFLLAFYMQRSNLDILSEFRVPSLPELSEEIAPRVLLRLTAHRVSEIMERSTLKGYRRVQTPHCMYPA